MSIKALIWDLQGVLLVTQDESIEISMAKRLNLPIEKIGTLFHDEFNDRVDIGDFKQEDFWTFALDHLGLPPERLPELSSFFEDDFFIDQELLDQVRQYHKRFKSAMLSNFSEALRSLLETRWNVEGAFDEIIISWEVKMIKPQPQIYDYTLKKLHVAKEEAVLIDDRIVNIRGALDFGMHAIHYKNRSQAIADLEKLISANNMGYKKLESAIAE
jgi:FMN phosphatase YigB (HAD superfamily)